MAERRKIGIVFFYSEGWIAGSYYINNLINSLKLVEDERKPELYILSREKSDFERIRHSGYPYLKYLPMIIQYNLLERIINKLTRIVLGKNVIVKKYNNRTFNVVFPYQGNVVLQDIKHKMHWIPDFQERYYPQFFSEREVGLRTEYHDKLAVTGSPVIFSSANARNDFLKFYPGTNCKSFVLHFASALPEYSDMDISALKQKYNITGRYFISPNQFWKHKNHMIVLKAIKLLKDRGQDLKVVFTGKESDHRNPDYFEGLKKYMLENDLSDAVRFLGFIDRSEQLKLMSEALCVIQPSLFEGWSTVVEDAKAMNQYVLLSNIDVHKEQMTENVAFFNPLDPNELAEEMMYVMNAGVSIVKHDYTVNIRKFGEDFIRIVDEITGHDN